MVARVCMVSGPSVVEETQRHAYISAKLSLYFLLTDHVT